MLYHPFQRKADNDELTIPANDQCNLFTLTTL